MNNKPTILIIDDEVMIYEMFNNTDFCNGYELFHATNGAEGLEFVEKCQPDIILLDIYMPVFDGFEFLEQLQPKLDDPYEVIVITGDNRDDVIKRCYQLGVSAFLHKPINMIEAEEIINRSIRIKQLACEKRAMEVQLRHEQKLRAIGQLSAGIAHEVNTPMQFVNANLIFLKKSFNDMLGVMEEMIDILSNEEMARLSPEAESYISQALERSDYEFLKDEIPKALFQSKEGVDRVTRIITAMKEFSHPGEREKSKIDINKSIENTLTVAGSELKYVASVHADLDYSIPLVDGYLNEMNQALLNIIINSAHAIEDKNGRTSDSLGELRIKTSFQDNVVEIKICDSGDGIPKQIQNRIFEPFFTTKEVGRGTGQGLSIAYNVIVTLHHGNLFFETKEGEGTCFYIHLPIKQHLESS